MKEHGVIDWNRVAELRDEMGDDGFCEVVELFLEEVDEVMTRLKTRPDPTQFEADFHFLKGCALNLGFSDFCKICQDNEHRAANGLADTIILTSAFEAYSTSRHEFLTQLEQALVA